MSPLFCGARFTSPRQQRGAIGLMAAITLGLVLIMMLLVIDSGRLYLEQRKLQRVADMAVLEAVSRGGNCTSGTALDFAKQSATRNAFTPSTAQTIAVSCGTLITNAKNLRTFSADPSKSDAIRVIATNTLPTSVAGGMWNLYYKGTFGFNSTLTASAVGAIGGAPLAALTIRSALLKVDSTKSAILNGAIGGFLGGKLTLDAISWQGLVDTDINLLNYLDQLAIDLKLNAGDYSQLVNANVTPTQLINAAIKVMEKGGPATSVALNGLKSISLIASNTQILKLGDLLKIQNGTSSAGLDTNMKVFNLIQGFAQLSNGKSTATTNFKINIPLIGDVTIQAKVIEPPQMSNIGNPLLAKKDPLGTNKIFVRTAQVRTAINVELAIVKTLSQITSALTQILSPVTDVVNNLLNLNLLGVVNNLLCTVLVPCDKSSLSIASDINLYLEAGSASSYVTDYSCSGSTSKSLTVMGSTSLAKLYIGDISPSTPFSSTTDISADPIKLISIDITKCGGLLGLGKCAATRYGEGGSLLLKVQTQVAAQSRSILYSTPNLPDINTPPYYQNLLQPPPPTDIIKSLGDTLNGIQLTSYAPPTGKQVGTIPANVVALMNQISGVLVTTIQNLLSPLLDPIVNTLLQALGISLSNAEIGANLSCNQGGRAQLVL